MTAPPLYIQVQVLARQLGIDYNSIKWDHIHPKGLDGPDNRHSPDNWQALSKAQHDTKTFGKGGEKRITTYGSDIHAIRKADRIRKSRQHELLAGTLKNRSAIRKRKAASKWPKRPMRKP